MGKENQQLGIKADRQKTRATRKEILELLESQSYRCALSGVSLTPETAELDHILPVSMGGTNLIDNLQVLHKEVNRMKGNMDNARFVELCKLVSQQNQVG